MALQLISLLLLQLSGFIFVQTEDKVEDLPIVNPIPPNEVRASCLSATDQCIVCKLDGEGSLIGCSLPGIACMPTKWRCIEKK